MYRDSSGFVVSCCLLFSVASLGLGSMWKVWWTYEGISGPAYWGVVNPEWRMCSVGKQQSPVDIHPKTMLYDPNLKKFSINRLKIGGELRNVGHGIVMDLNGSTSEIVNISAGPLSYMYRAYEIKFHYSNNRSVGSEHTVAGKAFVGELQVMAYNIDLYPDSKEAAFKSKGIVGVAAFMELSEVSNKALEPIVKQIRKIPDKHRMTKVRYLSLDELLPKTDYFMTYEGSLTEPGCHETVTWIIFNRPIYVSKEQLDVFRVIFEDEDNRPAFNLQHNSRPVMPLNHRVIRTNINFPKPTRLCTMEKRMRYKVNPLFEDTS